MLRGQDIFAREVICRRCVECINKICRKDSLPVKLHAEGVACPIDKFTESQIAPLPPVKPPEPLPRDEWPLPAIALAACAIDADAGLGDTLHRCLKTMGIAWIVAKGADVPGKDCGCAKRRKWLNARYPFKSPKTIARDIPNG